MSCRQLARAGLFLAMEGRDPLTGEQIVEAHRETKVDSPSGTAVRTAELIAAARAEVRGPLRFIIVSVIGFIELYPAAVPRVKGQGNRTKIRGYFLDGDW